MDLPSYQAWGISEESQVSSLATFTPNLPVSAVEASQASSSSTTNLPISVTKDIRASNLSPSDTASSSNDRKSKQSKFKRTRRTMWHNDGPDSSISSLSLLLDWLTTEGNYRRWRGDKQSGETKSTIATQISGLIHEKGVMTLRKPKDIITKVGQLEQSFRDAVDFLSNTGAGITDEKSLQEAILRRCPHYDVLKVVMDDRPSTRPLITNEDPSFVMGDTNEDLCHSNDIGAGENELSEPCQKKQRRNPAEERSHPSIRARSPSVSSTLSEWSELNSTLARTKALDREGNMRLHENKLAMKREQFQQSTQLEERRVVCAEDETKSRVLLLQAQAAKERFQAQKEEILMKVELARSRKRLRDEGIPEAEIDAILPIYTN